MIVGNVNSEGEAELGPSSPTFTPLPIPSNWDEAAARLRQRMDAKYGSKQIIPALMSSALKFVAWAKANNKPFEFDVAAEAALIEEYRASFEPTTAGSILGKSIGIAKQLLAERADPVNPGPPVPVKARAKRKKEAGSPTPDPKPSLTPEQLASISSPLPTDSKDSMPRPDETTLDPLDPELDEDGPEEEDPQQEEEEAPKRRPLPRAQQVVYTVPMPRRAAAPRVGPPKSKLIPTMEKIRISKRGPNGALAYIQDYTSEEIGNMDLHRFIKEYVDPEHGDPSGTTRYEAVPVDAHDKPRGVPANITISSPQAAQGNPAVDQIRDVVSLVNDLREQTTDEQRSQQDMLNEMKRKAAGSGDMGQMMMLMMMSNLMAPKNDTAALVAVAEKIYGKGAPAAPPSNPFPMFHPPAPHVSSTTDKVIEAMLLKALNPPPAVDFFEQMMKFTQMQNLMHPPNAQAGLVDVMKAGFAAMEARLAGGQSSPPGSIDAALGTFEKLSTVVKTLAPTLNAGGITGMLQSVFTPDLMKTVGNLAAQAMQGAGVGVPGAPGVPGAVPAKQLPATAPAAAAAPAPQPAQPQLPQPVVDKANSLKIAQTREVQLTATIDLVQTMYLGPFRENLEPILAELMQGKVDKARIILSNILKEVRPDLDQPTFVDDVMRQMFTANGQPVPAALDDKRPNAKVIPLVTEVGTANGAKVVVNPPVLVQPPAVPYADTYAAQAEAAAQGAKVKEREPAAVEEVGPVPSPTPAQPPQPPTPVDVHKFEPPAVTEKLTTNQPVA